MNQEPMITVGEGELNLLGRIKLAEFALQTLSQVDDSDNRKQSAIEHYTKQLKELKEKYNETMQDTNVVIALDTVTLKSERK